MLRRISEYSKKNKISAVCVLVSVLWSLLSVLLVFLFPSLFKNINFQIFDWKMSFRPPVNYSPSIVHVDVDDEAVKEFGQWPWDRALSAKLVEKLSEFGAKVISFDIFYSSAGKSKEGNEKFFTSIRQAGNVVSATGLGGFTDSDEKPLNLTHERSEANFLYDKSLSLAVPAQFNLLKAIKVQGSALPLLPIIQGSKGIGHIAATPDSDGVYRKVPLLVKLGDRIIPSLSFATLIAYWDLTPERIALNLKNEIEISRDSELIRIPIDNRGMFLINWGKPWTSFKHYSAKDVLSDTPDPSRALRYKDKIVIVDVTSSGSTDFGTTPVAINSPLSRIHSHVLNTILTNSFIASVPPFPWIMVCSVILTVAFPLMSGHLSLKLETLLAGLFCIISFAVTSLCFFFCKYDIPYAEFFLIFAPAACASIVIRGASIEWQVAQAKKALERYLPPELLEKALGSGMNPDVSTRRQEITIVFVDMKSFSTLSESVDVEYISRFLKGFFEGMTQAILKHQGRIHQFLGDGFLAVFGDLVPIENHAEAAFMAALDMQEEMIALNSIWMNSGITEFAEGISIRIGINTGMAFVGDLGSDRRLEYAVVGSAVNIAARLQALAPPGGIMMTSRTRALLKDPAMCQGPEKVKLKGIERDVEVYTICPDALRTS